jgi:hypothetical protein
MSTESLFILTFGSLEGLRKFEFWGDFDNKLWEYFWERFGRFWGVWGEKTL